MTFAPDDEQRELTNIVRSFFADKAGPDTVRRQMATVDGFDKAVWDQMAKELGLQALHIPEAYGGMGFTFVELGLVLEEMGRALLCAPYLSSVVLAANAVLNAGTETQRHTLLPGIAAGQTRATLAVAEQGDLWDPASIETQAHPESGGHRLYGTKTAVIDGHSSDVLVVAAREPGTIGEDGIGLYVVEPREAVARTPLPTLDQTRKLARIEFDGAPGQRLGDREPGWPALLRTLRQAAVCLSAEQVGGAQACLDMAVGHAKVRAQFGRPIGGFQAIKHRCADMLLATETARSAAWYALEVAAEDAAATGPAGELAIAASLARSHCAEVFSRVASDTVQVHGGVGFTWEHDAHLYLKRAKGSEVLLGGVARHRELVARQMGL